MSLSAREWADLVGADKYLELAAMLAAKKALVRAEIADKKFAKDSQSGTGSYGFKYFSESKYKSLLNQLFSKHGLELTACEIASERYPAVQYSNKGDKPANGVQVTWEYTITDTETGFSESMMVSGTGFDTGDKGIYKADTGAFKYFAANNFLVATGDDPEATDDPDTALKKKKEDERKAAEDAEYADLMCEIITLKQEAEDAGVDLQDPAQADWLRQATGVPKGKMPKNLKQAKDYKGAIKYMTDCKRATVQA